jgi:hypothetical protein
MKTTINVSQGKLAVENTATQEIREQLAKEKHGKVAVGNISAQEIRERIANDLKYGRPIELDPSGNVAGQTGKQKCTITITIIYE